MEELECRRGCRSWCGGVGVQEEVWRSWSAGVGV